MTLPAVGAGHATLLSASMAPCVLREDRCFIALDKPAGLLAVPGRGELAHDSLAQRAQAHWADARVVHRLDMATSGIMLMALGAHWQRELSQCFAQRAMHKQYVAVVGGLMCDGEGEIDLPLCTDWPNRPRQHVDAVNGKPSLTRYRVVSRDTMKGQTRVLLTPVTGRSHQLRVHLLALGHPIVGDALYAPPDLHAAAPRLLLHAQALAFEHPGGDGRVELYSAPPF